VFDLELAMRGEMPIAWRDDYPARFGVMPREGTDADVRWFEIDPCYVFHPMNAYESGDTVVVDAARLDHIWRDGAMDFPLPALHRWTIDLATGAVREEQVDDLAAEFPRVADTVVGKEHRFGYMMANATEASIVDPMSTRGSIVKYDRISGERTGIDLGPGRIPGEAVFVAADGGRNEDDGYLMTYVYDASTDTSDFAIFDAATMSDDPVALVHLPRVPFGFHGNWIPSTTVG
jgi:carotenoid cleavage dioxygenase